MRTPGPWVYSDLLPASVGAPNGSITIVPEVGGRDDRECAANARAIAGLPTLIEETVKNLKTLRSVFWAEDDQPFRAQVAERIRMTEKVLRACGEDV